MDEVRTMLPERGFVLRMSHGRDRVPEAIDSGTIVLGWSKAVGLLETDEWETFRGIIRSQYHRDEKDFRKAGRAAGDAWRFLKEMKPGSYVVVPWGNQFYVAEVIGGPTYDASEVEDDSAYQMKVRWLNHKRPVPRKLARAALQSRMKIYGTTANASDLIGEIADALASVVEPAEVRPTFDSDLRARLVEKALQEIRTGRLDSFGFEHLVAAILRATGGASVRIVPRNQDKGADVTGEFRIAGAVSVRVAVQAKHYNGGLPIGRDVVDQLVRGMDAEDAQYGMIMTSGDYSADTVDYVRQLEDQQYRRIELVDGEQLAALVVDHGLRAVDVGRIRG